MANLLLRRAVLLRRVCYLHVAVTRRAWPLQYEPKEMSAPVLQDF